MVAVGLPTRRAHGNRVAAVIVVTTVVGLLLRIYQVLRPGVLYSTGSGDDGVYFGASVRLLHGGLPYRDYILVHPPLIAILMTPFAALSQITGTAQAFALARLATVLVGAAGVVLMGLVLRRFGTVAVAVGCTVLAVHDASVATAHTIFLEPYLVLFLLAGLLVLFDGGDLAGPKRQFWGSVLIGLACAVKIWAIAPAAVLVVLALLRRGPSADRGASARGAQVARVAGGILLGFAVPTLPIAVFAPSQFVRDVFLAQLQRSGHRTPEEKRIANMLGLDATQNWAHGVVLTIGALVGVALVASWAWMWWRAGRRLDFFATFTIAATAVVLLMFMVADQFYPHYAAFFVPFLALALALPAGALARRAASRAMQGVGVVVSAVLAVTLVVGCSTELRPVRYPGLPVAAIDARIPPGACVVSNSSSLALEVNRFVSTRSCPQLIDPFGTDLVYGRGREGRTSDEIRRVRRYWADAVDRAQYLLLARSKLHVMPWRWLFHYVERDFHKRHMHSRRFVVWQRDTNGIFGRRAGRRALERGRHPIGVHRARKAG